MVKVSEIYKGGEGGRFLNVQRVDEAGLWETALTIADVELREINDREKLVVHFKEIEDVLVLNKTNAMILAEAFGEETEEWELKQIMLRKTKRSYGGKLVDAIEVVPLKQEEIDMSKGKKRKK